MVVRGDSHLEDHAAFRVRDLARMRILSREDKESTEDLRFFEDRARTS